MVYFRCYAGLETVKPDWYFSGRVRSDHKQNGISISTRDRMLSLNRLIEFWSINKFPED